MVSEVLQSKIKSKFKKRDLDISFGYVSFYENELNEILKDNIIRNLITPMEWYLTGTTEFIGINTEEKTGNTVYVLFCYFIRNNWEPLFKFNYSERELTDLICMKIQEKYPELII